MSLDTRLKDVFAEGQTWLNGQLSEAKWLQPMLAAGAVAIFIAMIFIAASAASTKAQQLRNAQADLSRLQQQLKDGSWNERRQESQTIKFQLRDRFWTAETAGLAEASLERWLRDRVESLGVRADSIRVQRSAVTSGNSGTTKGSLAGVQRMTAKLVMPFEPEAVYEVLKGAAANEKILVVERLLLRSGRNALVEMDVSTFVVLPENAR
jgi:hypothetical protein